MNKKLLVLALSSFLLVGCNTKSGGTSSNSSEETPTSSEDVNTAYQVTEAEWNAAINLEGKNFTLGSYEAGVETPAVVIEKMETYKYHIEMQMNSSSRWKAWVQPTTNPEIFLCHVSDLTEVTNIVPQYMTKKDLNTASPMGGMPLDFGIVDSMKQYSYNNTATFDETGHFYATTYMFGNPESPTEQKARVYFENKKLVELEILGEKDGQLQVLSDIKFSAYGSTAITFPTDTVAAFTDQLQGHYFAFNSSSNSTVAGYFADSIILFKLPQYDFYSMPPALKYYAEVVVTNQAAQQEMDVKSVYAEYAQENNAFSLIITAVDNYDGTTSTFNVPLTGSLNSNQITVNFPAAASNEFFKVNEDVTVTFQVVA